jgi:predicted nucleic acid-binding protein
VTVLADTSVWIAHLRKSERLLADLLNQGVVLIHPFVVGELACGNLKDRSRVLRDLNSLPRVVSATHDEVFELVDKRSLWGSGIGWVDAHLLAACLLSHCFLWTLDGRLQRAAGDIGLNLQPVNSR